MPQARSSSAKRRSATKSSGNSAAKQRKNTDSAKAAKQGSPVSRGAAGTDVPSTVVTVGAGKDAKPYVQINDLTKRSDADIIPGHFATIVSGDHEFTFPDPDVTVTDPKTGAVSTKKAPERKIALTGQRVVFEAVVTAGDDGYPDIVRVRLGRPSSAPFELPYSDLAPASA